MPPSVCDSLRRLFAATSCKCIYYADAETSERSVVPAACGTLPSSPRKDLGCFKGNGHRPLDASIALKCRIELGKAFIYSRDILRDRTFVTFATAVVCFQMIEPVEKCFALSSPLRRVHAISNLLGQRGPLGACQTTSQWSRVISKTSISPEAQWVGPATPLMPRTVQNCAFAGRVARVLRRKPNQQPIGRQAHDTRHQR